MQSRTQRSFAAPLLLLALSVFINYIDRGNLSIAAPLLKNELNISASQLGILFAAFFWAYTAMQFVCGWLVDRFDVNRILATGYLLWSLATVATGLVHGFVMLLVMRLALGVGESVAFPCYSKIFARHLLEHHRGLANAVITAGVKCGPCSWCFGCRAAHGALWLAPGVHRNRFSQPNLAASLDEVDAARRWLSTFRNLPARSRHFATALILGCLRRLVLRCILPLFHSDLASSLPRS